MLEPNKLPPGLSITEQQQELSMQNLMLDLLKKDQRATFNPSYPQLQFLLTKAQEAVIAGGNGQGKSWVLIFMQAIFATGDYPDWWTGIRFTEPITGMIGGKKLQSTNDVLLNRILGPYGMRGTGMIPKDKFHYKDDIAPSGAGRGQVSWFHIKQKIESPLTGLVEYKKSQWHIFSGDQEEDRIMGYFPHIILLDEEPKRYNFYDQLRARMIHKDGFFRCSFTPEKGRTRFFNEFQRGFGGREMIVLTVDTTEHWDEAKKQKERDRFEHSPNACARLYAIPVEGKGVIYTIPDANLRGELPYIPGDWPQIIGTDLPHTGGTSACTKWVFDLDNQVAYLLASWKKQGATMSEFCSVIRGWGGTLVPVAWPHDGGRKYGLGTIAKAMRDEGLNMLSEPAHTLDVMGKKVISTLAVIEVICEMMSLGQMRWLAGNEEIFEEKREYRQKDGTPIPHQEEHLLHSMHTAITMRRFAKAVDLRSTGWGTRMRAAQQTDFSPILVGEDPYEDL